VYVSYTKELEVIEAKPDDHLAGHMVGSQRLISCHYQRSYFMSNTTDIDKSQETEVQGVSSSLVNQIEAGNNDCLSCRIVGCGTFAGVGIYALMQARATAPGSPAQKRIIGGLGVGVCYVQ